MLHFSFLRCRLPAALIVALLGLLLGGCESQSVSLGKKIDYKSTTTTAPLEIPPDLTTPAYDDRYLASTASGAAAAKAAGVADLRIVIAGAVATDAAARSRALS